MALAPEMLPFEPVVVSVFDVKLPTITTSPVTLPPTFAFSELLARMNAALAYCPVAFCELYAEFACINAELAYCPVAFCELYAEFA